MNSDLLQCQKCLLFLEKTNFHNNKSRKTKKSPYCKKCKKVLDNSFYQQNKSILKIKHKNYYIANKEKIQQKFKLKYSDPIFKEKDRARVKTWQSKNKFYYQNYKKEYYQKNKKEINKKALAYKNKNLQTKIIANLRSRLSAAIKNNLKTSSTKEYLGCSLEEFKKHLEKQFTEGMNWTNYGYQGWHIDHIIPCFKFDFKKEKEIKKCFHYTNLQPLWANDNFVKNKF